MWRIAVADMNFRRRRFVITVFATAVVFAMTLLTSGVSAALHEQNHTIVDSFHADRWFVAAGASGPFTTSTPIPAAVAQEVSALPGVTRANAVVLFRATIERKGTQDVNIVALPPDGLGTPRLARGHEPKTSGDVVADTSLGLDVGATVDVSGHSMIVVGTARHVSYYFGTPTIFMSLADAQSQFFGFLPLASAVVATGGPVGRVPGLRSLDANAVRADLKRPTLKSDQTIQFINVLLWIAAVGIVGSIVYLSAIERVGEFAVMKATGASNRSLLSGLALQSVVLSVASAIAAGILARVLAPGFPFPVRVTTEAYTTLVLVALVVGLAASGAGLRRAVKVDPALAFGGS